MTIYDKTACLFALLLAVAAAPAEAEDSFFDSLAKSTGLMATPPDPPAFVKATRPKETPEAIPVYAAPDEPRSKVKSAAELKAMDQELDRASHAQDGLRPTAPQDRARKKAKAKPPAQN